MNVPSVWIVVWQLMEKFVTVRVNVSVVDVDVLVMVPATDIQVRNAKFVR